MIFCAGILVIIIYLIINESNRLIAYYQVTTDLFYIMCMENEWVWQWHVARVRIRTFESLKTDWHSWEAGIIEHSCAVIWQSLWETGTSIEKQSARETVKEIGRDCECKREKGGWALLAHKISFSPHSPFFICITEEEKDWGEEEKRAQDSDAKPLLFLQPWSKAVICEREKQFNWITGVRTQAQKRKGKKIERMKENCGQLLIHSTIWHGIEKTAQSNRIILFLCWFPALVSSFCLLHVLCLFFRPRGGR